MVLRLRQPIRRIGSRRTTTRRSFQRGGRLPNPVRIAPLAPGGATCEVDTVLLRQSPCAGSTRKREAASRRAPMRRATQIFLITTAAPFPRHSYCSSKNVRESPIKAQKKALCTRKPQTAHLYGVRPSCLGASGDSFCTGTSQPKSQTKIRKYESETPHA